MFISYQDIQGNIGVDDLNKLRTPHQLPHQNRQRIDPYSDRSTRSYFIVNVALDSSTAGILMILITLIVIWAIF